MMFQRSGQKRAADYLYPHIDPFDMRMVDMCDGHTIYVEQCGRPDGIPVVVFHGGPGGGCSPAMRRYFDPSVYRVVLFDQRGCGRSRPHASVENNTTWHLIADIERIRAELEIEQFIAFGGSWGATLALIYAISHPTRLSQMVLRGVFLMTKAELDWFYGGGVAAFYPDLWEEFLAILSEKDRVEPVAGYHRLLFSGDVAQETRAGKIWSAWENALASVRNTGPLAEGPAEYSRTFARLENHYFYNAGFLEYDGWILAERERFKHIPTVVVQGRYDMICPPVSAWKLASDWSGCELRIVPFSGHALSETGISEALVSVMDDIARRL